MAELPMPKDYEGSVCEIKTMENELIAIGTVSYTHLTLPTIA